MTEASARIKHIIIIAILINYTRSKMFNKIDFTKSFKRLFDYETLIASIRQHIIEHVSRILNNR